MSASQQRRHRFGLLVLVAAVVGTAPAIVTSMPDAVRIPMKEKHDEPKDAALFSHWAHEGMTCFTCHPSLFPRAPKSFTHADMDAGKYCGACHNGVAAWSYADADCEVCHRPPSGTKNGGATP